MTGEFAHPGGDPPHGLADGAALSGLGEERPGDPACWLRRVCPACGSVMEEDPPTRCPVCHAEIPAD